MPSRLLYHWACLCVAIAVIAPTTSLPFRMGVTNQLIALGFLLSIMNMCMKRTGTFLFLLIEARFGQSRLQKYQGLLEFSPTAYRLSMMWRLILVIVLGLPLVLSAMYKRYLGGASTYTVSYNGSSYGLVPAPGLAFGLQRGLALMTNATLPFAETAAAATQAPDFSKGPLAYGFNSLLLSTNRAAALDAPVPEYVQQLQNGLQSGSFYTLTASVQGFVTINDDSVANNRDDASFWAPYFDSAPPTMVSLYEYYSLCFMNVGTAFDNSPQSWDDSWTILSFVPYPSTNSTEAIEQSVMSRGMLFNTARHNCWGTWIIGRQSLRLVAGDCESAPLNSSYQFLSNTEIALTTYYPGLLAEFVGVYSPDDSAGNSSAWATPSLVVAVVLMYWSRCVAILLKEGKLPSQYYYFTNATYTSDTSMTLTIPTLASDWTLYLVMGLQPLLTILALLVALLMYKTPIGPGFGTIAILAGMDESSRQTLRGAALSGKLSKPIEIQIGVESWPSEVDENVDTIRYTASTQRTRGRLRRSKIYA